MKQFFPKSFYNTLTLFGATIAGISFGLFLFLMILDLFDPNQKPYMGIITFIILPIILFMGIVVIVAGILREHHLEKVGRSVEHVLPRIDFNNPTHRKTVVIVGSGVIALLFFSAFGSFKAYEYTDSDAFCGTMCHTVMLPEYTAYSNSPHARVGCVKCHIGPGAGWFVRSKLSGAYQVYATVFNKYPHPIPTPIKNLRPAQETCEQCHWPRQFFSEKKITNTYFLSDEKNTKWTINLLVRIGGGNAEAGPTSGIHWHMNIANQITYAAIDSQRQIIPWVRVRNAHGEERVYQSTDNSLTEDQLAKLEKRNMDCIDCHNRPTHIYQTPMRSVDRIMSLGWIDPSLPSVKSICVQALEKPYLSQHGALDSIREVIQGFYRTNYPERAVKNAAAIEQAIVQVQKIYSRNYFPEMNVSWKRFVDNVGHLFYPGCFRCHDGKHVAQNGKVLSRDCNVCHIILAQEKDSGPTVLSLDGIQFNHPVDIGDSWKEMNCSDCHNPS